MTSKLDSCNALLGNLPETEIKRLQQVQNIAARIVTKVHKKQHSTPLLSTLHWLPIHLRIQFKILLLVFKSLNGSTPSYIFELNKDYAPTRNLRSTRLHLFQTPRVNTKCYGQRAFSTLAPTLWNSLPPQLPDASTVNSFKNS
ncbi:uncharacterized protein [Diadema setosum]|uniref:uncharacterized protein n=1 Tax=Diadema setosum TaxID=31175 RepID=UPI003B3A583F